ncbi:MAG: trypsin-like serine protease, partial [Proteobacteria bacterium]|nr:trypsin-like serine protease [Pseudomonadota bacterium]
MAFDAFGGIPERDDSREEDIIGKHEEDAKPIINGDETELEQFPMAGALIVDGIVEFDGYDPRAIRWFLCSSVLVAPDVVMAAAHCADWEMITKGEGAMRNVTMRWTRETDVTALQGWEVAPWPDDSVKIHSWSLHPDWDLHKMVTPVGENADLALFFLDEPLIDAPLGILPGPEDMGLVKLDAPVAVVGWGRTEEGTSGIKHSGVSEITEVSPWEFQVGDQVDMTRQCFGDSGGPTFAASLEGWTVFPGDDGRTHPLRVVGVTSHLWDSTDCTSKGALSTRIDYYLDWIDSEMRARCADNTRKWCDEQGVLPPEWFFSHEPEEVMEDHKTCNSTGTNASWLLL